MATEETNGDGVSDEQKKPGFFPKFIFLGVLPFLYAVALATVILHFTGIKFDTQVKWVESHTKVFLPKKESKAVFPKEKAVSSGKAKQASTIGPSKTPAHSIKPETGGKVSSPPTNENVDQVSSNSNAQNATGTSTVSLESMDPSDAAKLLSNMSETDALRNLKQLNANTQSAIIAEMPADVGARLTAALESGQEPATSTDSSSQLYKYMKPDQIAAILSGIKNNDEVLRQIKQLDPDTASQVLAQLNPQVAAWVVTHLN